MILYVKMEWFLCNVKYLTAINKQKIKGNFKGKIKTLGLLFGSVILKTESPIKGAINDNKPKITITK